MKCLSRPLSPTAPAVSYLCEKRLVDFHAFIRALGQDLASAVPAVADGRVGVGHASQEHGPLVVELLLGLSDALMHRHHRVVQICRSHREAVRDDFPSNNTSTARHRLMTLSTFWRLILICQLGINFILI